MRPTPPSDDPEPAETSAEWSYARKDRTRRNSPLRRAFRTVRRNVLAPAVPIAVPVALRSLARSWRVRVEEEHLRRDVLEGPDGCIAVLWHGRMAAAATLFRGVDASILVSASGDGDLAESLLARLGYRTLRGSTGKIGIESLKELRRRLDGGGVIALTPDGPRGPRHHVNPGAAFLARATKRVILPIGFATDRAVYLKSWDRFTLPKPFARVQVVMGEPIAPPTERGEAALAEVSARIGASLEDAERRAFRALGKEVDW